MKFSRIVLAILFPFISISCSNKVDSKRTIEQDKNTFPSTEHQKTKKSSPQIEEQNPLKNAPSKELKKKQLKKIDTLKPVAAIP